MQGSHSYERTNGHTVNCDLRVLDLDLKFVALGHDENGILWKCIECGAVQGNRILEVNLERITAD